MNTCDACKWYQRHRDATTKRVRPSEKGHCTWQFPWPKVWPESFMHHGYNCSEAPPRPYAVRIWGHIDHRCECWEAKDSAKAEPKEIQCDMPAIV